MEFKGTKGNWSIDRIDIVSDKSPAIIAQVFDGLETHVSEQDEELQSANAKLIASSPKLLEALQSLLSVKTDIIRDMNFACEGNGDDIEWRFEEAERAIKSALQ